MPLTLTDFIGHIKRNSVARPNRYDIVFTLPSNLINNLDDSKSSEPTVGAYRSQAINNAKSPVGTERMMALSCLSAEIPAVSMQTSDTQYGNYVRRVVHDRVISEFRTTFILTGELNEKRLFDAWQNIMLKQENHRVEYYDDYITSISVECLNVGENTVYHYELTEAYPLSVGQVQLDRTSQNSQMTLEVTWAFHKIKLDPNRYDLKTVTNADQDTLDMLTSVSSGSHLSSVTAKDLNLPMVPNKYYTKPELNDILKAAGRIRDQIKRGDMGPADALRLTRQLMTQFKELTGVPPGEFDEVNKFLIDLTARMPIKIPGIGDVPTRLPW